jgi:nucleotide-binding universal stress UspA family protein
MARRIRRILHATDFSKASEPALREAIDFAKDNDAELWVVHVIVPLTYAAGEFEGPELYAQLEETTRKEAESSMAKLIQRLKKANVKAKSLLLNGQPHDQIAKAAKSKKVDMIVIGTHGRTGFSKLFMGSVAGRVVSTADRPVLTVRGK